MSIREDELKRMSEEILAFPSYPGEEGDAQRWFADELAEFGFDCYEWEPDAAVLDGHDSFPPAEDLELDDRPSVAGVLEFGDPDAGPTLVLNGHMDVVPVEEANWSSDPFEPRWEGDRLYGRGAVDMKCGLLACVFAALAVSDRDPDVDGRIVVESVVGEEEGGIGAAMAALENPYPFERDAAIIPEPTGLALTVASEGSLMKRLELFGKSAHAARTWEGESVLPHFERIRRAFMDLESERSERVTHPLYERYETPWPVNFGTVEAGEWASSVPSQLVSEIRIGVAPQETVDEVEAEFEARLAEIVADSEWLSAHPPAFDRFSVQFEGSEIDPDEPIVRLLRETAVEHGIDEPTVDGSTGGADSRHYIAAGIPTVMFGPGPTELAHQSDEYVHWEELLSCAEILADTAVSYLQRG